MFGYECSTLRITQRFVGTEPYDLLTAGYKAQMQKIFHVWGSATDYYSTVVKLMEKQSAHPKIEKCLRE
jgi:citrate lyase synthetase